LGDSSTTDRLSPTQVFEPVVTSGFVRFTTIAVGLFHTCALTEMGPAYCWGFNLDGQLGNGTLGPPTSRSTPTLVTGGLTFVALVAGVYHTCGLTSDGAAYCWGVNGNGQLGIGEGPSRSVPTPVGGGLRFTSLAAGQFHTCGVAGTGVAYCWGSNRNGQLGDGTTTDRPQPALVSGGLAIVALSAGGEHSCGVTSAGAAYCWGLNSSSQLGDGTTTSRLTPTPVIWP
jgi:alpha-tubulin suppressor-like RCC1 family protein